MFGRATIRLGIGPHSSFYKVYKMIYLKRDILIRRGRLYSSCVRSSMLHGSETWPVRKKMRWHFTEQRRERL